MTLNNPQGFVVYKLPFEHNFHLRKGEWKKFDQQKKGFIVQKFNNSNTLIIESEKTLVDFPLSISPPSKVNKSSNLTKQEYINQVNSFIDACNLNLKKVISSRTISFEIKDEINLFDLFKNLANKYNNALVYIYNIPDVGMWMGASPETLVYANQSSIQTMALAGSLPISKKEIIWEEKEKQEHQFVIDDISSKLKSHNYSHKIEKTQTTSAGEVAHLKTLIQIDSKIEETTTIANILHPTSAICGMPQKDSLQFILKNETYNREFYTGYLGEINNKKQSWLFVNLRCMQIYNKNFKIYVGGGITKDSIAKKEWEETELKSRTLLSVIEKM